MTIAFKTRKVLAWFADREAAENYAKTLRIDDTGAAYCEVSFYPGDALPYEVVLVWENHVR